MAGGSIGLLYVFVESDLGSPKRPEPGARPAE